MWLHVELTRPLILESLSFGSPTGMPYRFVNLVSGATRDPARNPAEVDTPLPEFGTLSKHTGNVPMLMDGRVGGEVPPPPDTGIGYKYNICLSLQAGRVPGEKISDILINKC